MAPALTRDHVTAARRGPRRPKQNARQSQGNIVVINLCTHPGDAQRLMRVTSAVHAEAPWGAAEEGDFSGTHPASECTPFLLHWHIRVSRVAFVAAIVSLGRRWARGWNADRDANTDHTRERQRRGIPPRIQMDDGQGNVVEKRALRPLLNDPAVVHDVARLRPLTRSARRKSVRARATHVLLRSSRYTNGVSSFPGYYYDPTRDVISVLHVAHRGACSLPCALLTHSPPLALSLLLSPSLYSFLKTITTKFRFFFQNK